MATENIVYQCIDCAHTFEIVGSGGNSNGNSSTNHSFACTSMSKRDATSDGDSSGPSKKAKATTDIDTSIDRFSFYSKSSDKPLPGKGAHEMAANPNKYSALRTRYKQWRKMLSNFASYTVKVTGQRWAFTLTRADLEEAELTPCQLSDLGIRQGWSARYATIEHAFHSIKLRLGHNVSTVFRQLEYPQSDSFAPTGLDARKKHKAYMLNSAQLSTWDEISKKVMTAAATALYTQNELASGMLILTAPAQLYHYEKEMGKPATLIRFRHLEILRDEFIDEYRVSPRNAGELEFEDTSSSSSSFAPLQTQTQASSRAVTVMFMEHDRNKFVENMLTHHLDAPGLAGPKCFSSLFVSTPIVVTDEHITDAVNATMVVIGNDSTRFAPGILREQQVFESIAEWVPVCWKFPEHGAWLNAEAIFQTGKFRDEKHALLLQLMHGKTQAGWPAKYGQKRAALTVLSSNANMPTLDEFIDWFPDVAGDKSQAGALFERSVIDHQRAWKQIAPVPMFNKEKWDSIGSIFSMLVAIHAKFDRQFRGDTPEVQYMNYLATKYPGVPVYFVESRAADKIWADGGDGKGFNRLGKLLSLYYLRRYNITENNNGVYVQFINGMDKPNSDIFSYTNPKNLGLK